MADTPVTLSVRISSQNRVMWEAEKRRLQFLVRVGQLSEDAAMDQAEAIIQHLTEYRTNDGPWKPLSTPVVTHDEAPYGADVSDEAAAHLKALGVPPKRFWLLPGETDE